MAELLALHVMLLLHSQSEIQPRRIKDQHCYDRQQLIHPTLQSQLERGRAQYQCNPLKKISIPFAFCVLANKLLSNAFSSFSEGKVTAS